MFMVPVLLPMQVNKFPTAIVPFIHPLSRWFVTTVFSTYTSLVLDFTIYFFLSFYYLFI